MKNKKSNIKKKFAFGGTAMSVESPLQQLQEMISNSELAKASAENDPVVMGLQGLGVMASGLGMSTIGQGIGGIEGLQDIFGNVREALGGRPNIKGTLPGAQVTKLKRGGKVGKTQVEVEGKEVFQTPQGQVGEFQGPSHEGGGIPLSVKKRGVAKNGEIPEGTYIYPDSIKVNGKTLAERKKLREKKEKKLIDLLGDNGSDLVLKNTMKRVSATNQNQDNYDRAVQDYVKQEEEYDENLKKFARGGYLQPLPVKTLYTIPPTEEELIPLYNPLFDKTLGIKDPGIKLPGIASTPVATSTDEGGFSLKDLFNSGSAGMPTFGDAMGMAGNLFQAFAPMQNTLDQRAGDTPNINPYENYGDEALKTLESSKQYLQGILDNTLSNARLSRQGTINRNNKSAMGINTQRALNLATDAQFNNLEADTFAKNAEQMMGLNNTLGQVQLDISGKKATGEQYRDEADRKDRDAFYTNLAANLTDVGAGISRTGKAVNEIKARGVQSDFMNMLYDNVQGNVMSGTISQKAGVENTAGRDLGEVIEEFKATDYFKKLSKEDKEAFEAMTQLQKAKFLGITK